MISDVELLSDTDTVESVLPSCWFLFTSFRSAFLGKKMLKNDQVLAIVEIDWTT